MVSLSTIDRYTLNQTSQDLGVNPGNLEDLIWFESKWDPQAVNQITKARGLIQFMPDTARGMGYKGSLDLVTKNKTIREQLRGPVLAYLKPYMPFTDKQSLYLAVFYPKFRFADRDTVFNAKVQEQNPGIKTVGDYMDKVAYSVESQKNLPDKAANMLNYVMYTGIVLTTWAVVGSLSRPK